MRNGNFLKMRGSEIRVRWIRVNQGLGVYCNLAGGLKIEKCFVIFGQNLLQDEIVLMLIQGTIPSKAFYLLHSIIRKPGKTTCYIAISNSAFPCGSKPYVFEKVSNHLNRLPSISYLKKGGYGLTNMYTTSKSLCKM